MVSYLTEAQAVAEPFQVWTLRVADQRATLTMTDGNSPKAIITQDIEYTDFPLAEITLWMIQNSNKWVLLLPGEY